MNSILKKITLLFAASALVTGFTGCSEDDADAVSSSQDNIVLEQHVSHANFEIRSNTSWIAECIAFDQNGAPSSENWFRITPSEGVGTKQIALDVLSDNHTEKTRMGQIKVTYSNGKTHLIRVKQHGLTDIETAVTPQQIGVGAKPSAGNLFTVSVANRDAKIAAEVLSGNDWLTGLTKSHDLSFGYSRKEAWAFQVSENTASDARKAEIRVTVKFGYNTYEYIVTVTQSGLGAPAVMTAPTVYMNNAQTTHRQSIWTEGGDKTNVNFTTTWTSAYNGVDNQTGWITNAEITGHELVITAEKNLDQESREGVVTIVASRSANIGESAYATLSVKVSQAGYKSAGIVVPVAEVAYPAAEKACTQNITLLNQSTAKSVTNNNATMFKVAPAIATGTSQLTYTLNPYNGAEGDYREAVITIVVGNKGSNDAIASLKVRQYAPTAPGISLPTQEIVINSVAQTDLPMHLNALNDATIEVISPTTGWLTAKMHTTNNAQLLYSATAYNGAEGDSREGVIVLKATKDTYHDAAYYYITVRQLAPDMPTISGLMQYIGLGSAASGTQELAVAAQNGATLTASSSANWLTADMVNGMLSYSAEAFTGGSAPDFCREAVITITATNAHKDPAAYYITVRQYGIQAASLPAFGVLSAAGAGIHANLINSENVTSMTIDASHVSQKYCQDDNTQLGETPNFLSFSDITSNSFHISWSTNNLQAEGSHTNIYRTQPVYFILTLANQRNQVLSASITQAR